MYLRQSLCFFYEQPSTRGCSKCRNEISFKAVPQEIILKQNRVERLWVFDIFRMAAKFNLKSGGALGGRRGPSAVSQWEGAFVVPLLFTFGIEGCGFHVVMFQLQNFSLAFILPNIIHKPNEFISIKRLVNTSTTMQLEIRNNTDGKVERS